MVVKKFPWVQVVKMSALKTLNITVVVQIISFAHEHQVIYLVYFYKTCMLLECSSSTLPRWDGLFMPCPVWHTNHPDDFLWNVQLNLYCPDLGNPKFPKYVDLIIGSHLLIFSVNLLLHIFLDIKTINHPGLFGVHKQVWIKWVQLYSSVRSYLLVIYSGILYALYICTG